MESKNTEEYIPGTCNIGRAEVANRYRKGYIGLVASIFLIAIIELFQLPPVWRLLLVFPAALAFTGFLQARQKFCLAYGFAGVFGMRGYRKTSRIADPAFLREDRKMAWSLVFKIAMGTIIVVTLYYCIPFLFVK